MTKPTTKNEQIDTEGHLRLWSDADIKHDVTPLADGTEEPEDTEGHGFKFPDSDVSTDDTEGQRFRPPGGPSTQSDDTEGNGFRPPTLTDSDDAMEKE